MLLEVKMVTKTAKVASCVTTAPGVFSENSHKINASSLFGPFFTSLSLSFSSKSVRYL